MENVKMYFHAFEGETKIPTASYPSNFTNKTWSFPALPDESILFYFELSHTILNDFPLLQHGRSEFALKLQTASKLNSSLTMDVDVEVRYSDGSLFKKYKSQSNLKYDKMKSCVTFETVTCPLQLQNQNMFSHDHSFKLMRGYLTVKCRMLFHDSSKSDMKYFKVTSSSDFLNNLLTVYETNVFKDFTFSVGDASFPVHKVMLAAHSPVLMKMWTSDCLESKTNSVTITDATPEMFGMFLKYLYSGEIEDKSWPSVKDLYYLAEKYDVGTLRNDCTAIAISFLDLDHVCDILEFAYTYNDSNLKLAAKKFAADHIKELRRKEDWKNLEETHVLICYEIVRDFVPE